MAMIISTLQMKKLRPKELNTCSVQVNGQVESRDSNSAESVPLFTMLQLPPFSSMAHDNALTYIYISGRFVQQGREEEGLASKRQLEYARVDGRGYPDILFHVPRPPPQNLTLTL